MTFPRYERYKASGVPWLGEIPAHWEVVRHLGLFDERREVNQPDMKLLSVTIERGVIPQSRISTKKDISNDDKSRYKVVRVGDLAYNKMRMWQGAVGISDYDGIVSPAYVILEPKNKAYSKFFHYLFRTKQFIIEADRYSYGLADDMNSLRYEHFKTIYSPVPPQEEVERIAGFLDERTAAIDAAIAKKERLLALLAEQKAILINTAVTRGLDPHASLKDSGIPWLGQIPAHWEVKRAKYIFHEVDERSQTGQEELLSVSHVTGVTPRAEKNVYMFMAEDYAGSKICRKNDLVINIMWAWMGALGISDRMGIVSPSYGVYRQQRQGIFNSWYLEHLLRSAQYVAEYNRRSTGLHSSRLRLYSHMFFDMELGYPSRKEQNEIEVQVKERTSLIDQTIETTSTEIERLNELRAILIASAVTGQIKL